MTKPELYEFAVFGHDHKGKGKIVVVNAEHSAEAIEIARNDNPTCRFNHCNLTNPKPILTDFPEMPTGNIFNEQ